MLSFQDRRVLVVGGGPVAARRAETFAVAGARVITVAPEVVEGLADVPGVELSRRRFETGDLQGVFAVCVATNDPETNARVAAEARRRGVLVNRADDADDGDFTVPAHGSRPPVTVAVDTDGASAASAASLRNEFLAGLDDGLLGVLTEARQWRRRVKESVRDARARKALLSRMTGPEAARILETGGRPALREWIEQLVLDASDVRPPADD